MNEQEINTKASNQLLRPITRPQQFNGVARASLSLLQFQLGAWSSIVCHFLEMTPVLLTRVGVRRVRLGVRGVVCAWVGRGSCDSD